MIAGGCTTSRVQAELTVFSLKLAPIEQALPLLSSLTYAGILPARATMAWTDPGHQTFPRSIPVSRPIATRLLLPQYTPGRNTLLHQPDRRDCGGARLSANRSAARGGACSCRCISIFLMTTGSSLQAMTLAVPPQTQHVSTSIFPKAPAAGENPLQPLRRHAVKNQPPDQWSLGGTSIPGNICSVNTRVPLLRSDRLQ